MLMQGRLNICRTSFAALLASLAVGCMEFSDMAEAIDDMRVIARIGVVAHPEIGSSGAEARLSKALSYFRARKADAIVIVGDLAKDGYLNQYRTLSRTWDKVFADPVKGIDPNPPRRICILGPHDREKFRDSFAGELGGTLFDEGEFDVKGFRFRVQNARPSAEEKGGSAVPVLFADGKPALTDELCFYPRDGAAVNIGSLSGVVVKPGYEPVSKASSASQGLFLSAYSGKVTVSRLDFTQKAPIDRDEASRIKAKKMPYAEKVANDWVVPLDANCAASPLSDKVPRFWDDTRLVVTRGTENGDVVYKVTWPPVLAKFTGERAFSYVVEAVLNADESGKGAVVKRAYVLSPNFHLSEDRDTSPVFCRFYASEFPAGAAIRFVVSPVSASGVTGPRLVSEPIS